VRVARIERAHPESYRRIVWDFAALDPGYILVIKSARNASLRSEPAFENQLDSFHKNRTRVSSVRRTSTRFVRATMVQKHFAITRR
jgi:hypothetical protein